MVKNTKKSESVFMPRKCSFSNRILPPKDHTSVQINIGNIGKDDVFDGKCNIYIFSGFLRKYGKTDQAINFLIEKFETDLSKTYH